MKTLCLLTILLLAAPEAVEVQKLDGSSASGNLIKMSADAVELESAAGQTETISTKNIISLTPAADSPSAQSESANQELFFADGTKLYLSNMAVTSRNAGLTLTSGEKVELGRSALKGVRFLPTANNGEDANLPDDDPLREKWNDLAEKHSGGDAIVLNREGMLTVQEVVIHEMNEEGIKIQLDDITTTVNASKLYGLLFFQRGTREFPAPLCVAQLQDGSSIAAKTLTMSNGSSRITTLTGAELPVPFNAVSKLDFAAGNIQFLDELKPSRTTWTPVLKSAISADDLSLVYAPRMNSSFHGEPLQLEEDEQPETYTRGIAIHATSEILYELPLGFRQLQMRVGIAPHSLGTCTATLQVIGDQKILFEKDFTDRMPPEDIALNIAGVRRLKIVVDASDGEDFGDVLHLCQARLLK